MHDVNEVLYRFFKFQPSDTKLQEGKREAGQQQQLRVIYGWNYGQALNVSPLMLRPRARESHNAASIFVGTLGNYTTLANLTPYVEH